MFGDVRSGVVVVFGDVRSGVALCLVMLEVGWYCVW